MPSSEFITLMDQKQDSPAAFKVELLEPDDTAHDVTHYYQSGGGISQTKDRAPGEIEAGSFDIVFLNENDTFSEYKAASVLFGVKYQGSWKVRISQGFVLADGTTEFLAQSTGIIDDIIASDTDDTVTIRCSDRIGKIVDGTLRDAPLSEVAIPGLNAGNGFISPIYTKPFKLATEDWTILCTTGGGDGVAVFSVTGSVTGYVNSFFSGSSFDSGDAAGGIKLSIQAGANDWAVGDKFTFSTIAAPCWSAMNPVKILWSILTGYNWNSDMIEEWSGAVLDYDHTQSNSNVDLDYNSFVQAIADVNAASFRITGFIPYGSKAGDFLRNLLVIFLGALYTGSDGRIRVSSFAPRFDTAGFREFSDAKQIQRLGYTKTMQEAINRISVSYKDVDVWEFSDVAETLNGKIVLENTDSTALFGPSKIPTLDFQSPWYSANGEAAQDFATRLLDRYGFPPVNINFETGPDALMTNIGDHVLVTDEKYGFSQVPGEIAHIEKNFEQSPRSTKLIMRRDSDITAQFGFLGSSADEGDGISPQASSWDSANDTDKQFIYLGADVNDEIYIDDTNTQVMSFGSIDGVTREGTFGVRGQFTTLNNYGGANAVKWMINGGLGNARRWSLGIWANQINEEENGDHVATTNTGLHTWEFTILDDDTLNVYVDNVLIANLVGGGNPTAPLSTCSFGVYGTITSDYQHRFITRGAFTGGPEYRLY